MEDADDLRQLATLLAANEPYGAVRTALTYLRKRSGARGAALLGADPRHTDVQHSNGRVDVARLAAAQRQLKRALEAGGLDADGFRLAVVTDAGEAVAVLLLDSPTAGLPAGVLAPLGRALRLLDESTAEPTRDASALLRLALERNDNNVSRVARLMRVSRRTIYQRMARWGIVRPPKGKQQA